MNGQVDAWARQDPGENAKRADASSGREIVAAGERRPVSRAVKPDGWVGRRMSRAAKPRPYRTGKDTPRRTRPAAGNSAAHKGRRQMHHRRAMTSSGNAASGNLEFDPGKVEQL
jgi:hypothetical protein